MSEAWPARAAGQGAYADGAGYTAMAGINVEENMYIDNKKSGGKENLVLDHVDICKILKMVCCPACCLFVPLKGKATSLEYRRQCVGCCNCPYAVDMNGVYQGRVADIGCCENGCWFAACPCLNCTGHIKLMSMQNAAAQAEEKIVFTKQLFPCWPCVQGCAVGCAPLGMACLSMKGCCAYCSGEEFLTIHQPVYKGPWSRASGSEPTKIGEMVQSYRFVPISLCCAIPTPLKFYYKPASEDGVIASKESLPLLAMTLMIYRGLPSPCKCCSPVNFQIPTGVSCLDVGLGTTTQWQPLQEVMRQADC